MHSCFSRGCHPEIVPRDHINLLFRNETLIIVFCTRRLPLYAQRWTSSSIRGEDRATRQAILVQYTRCGRSSIGKYQFWLTSAKLLQFLFEISCANSDFAIALHDLTAFRIIVDDAREHVVIAWHLQAHHRWGRRCSRILLARLELLAIAKWQCPTSADLPQNYCHGCRHEPIIRRSSALVS